jgi:hypothetical protein
MMSAFEIRKIRRNLAEGYRETKGLKNGHCNRRACQAPLDGKPQAYMGDHETFTNERLYYCLPCAKQFNDWDDKIGEPRRCTVDHETLTASEP